MGSQHANLVRVLLALAGATAIILTACDAGSTEQRDDAAAKSPREEESETTHPLAGQSAFIAYQTDRGGEGTWLIHPDGTDDHQIDTEFDGDLILPNWSPDGRRLVMTSRNTGGTEPLYEYNLKTEKIQPLFDCKDLCLGDDEPAYSPDGKQVAFIRAFGPIKNDRPSDCGLWLGDLKSGKVEQVTSNPLCDREYFPRWSPDGSRLTYWRWREKPLGNTTGTAVFVINADGTNERQLTDWKLFGGDPDWSPDGEWILFNTHPLPAFNFESKISNLYRIHPDGSGVEQLTDYETAEVRATQARYIPDGDRILFTAVTASSRELWVIPAEGGDPITVASDGIYTHGTWQP